MGKVELVLAPHFQREIEGGYEFLLKTFLILFCSFFETAEVKKNRVCIVEGNVPGVSIFQGIPMFSADQKKIQQSDAGILQHMEGPFIGLVDAVCIQHCR